MGPELTARPEWEIDRILGRLLGAEIRVAAKSFSPPHWNADNATHFLPVRSLYLPDNRQPAGLPVFFEGRLEHFERQISLVVVCLESSQSEKGAANGTLLFRGKTAVILRGPALVELAFPFQVERLPADTDNYWRDIHVPCAQFELPFAPAQAGKPGTRRTD